MSINAATHEAVRLLTVAPGTLIVFNTYDETGSTGPVLGTVTATRTGLAELGNQGVDVIDTDGLTHHCSRYAYVVPVDGAAS